MALQLDSALNLARHRDRDAVSNVAPLVAALLLGIVICAGVALTSAELGPQFALVLLLMAPAGILLFRYPFVAVILWMLIFPFVARDVVGLGVWIYRAIHLVMIPVTLWLVVLKSWVQGSKRPIVRFGPAEYVMGLSMLWAIGNMFILGEQPIRLILHWQDRYFVPYCMYWLVRLIAPTTADLKRFLPVAFFTLMTQAAIGALSWFAPKVLPQQWLGTAGERVVGTFHNPAVYTSTCLFLALLIFQYGMSSKSAWLRVLGIFTIGVGYVSILISFSRGSWLGGSLVLMGLAVLYPRVIIPLTTIAVVLIVGLGTTIFSHEVDFAFQRLNDNSTVQGRFETGAKSMGMIDQKPLFGWGYNNYDRFDENFRIQVNNITNENDKTSHNTYFTVMAEQGIPALIFYLFPAGWWLLQSLAVWRRLPRSGFWSATLLALLWLLMLDHFTVSNFMDMLRFNYFGTTIWWMALALIATIVESARVSSREPARAGKAWMGQEFKRPSEVNVTNG